VWGREVWFLHRMLVWHLQLPWSSRRWVPPRASGHPVLCVHGFTQDGTNFFPIRRALHARGRVTEAVTLGWPPRELAAYARVLERRLYRILWQTGAERVDVVCHSMGGLVLRAVLARHPGLGARIGRVVTIGTPHRGTGAARGAVLSLPETRVMHVRADWLQRTPKLIEQLPGHPVTTIGSVDDSTVFPVDSALADGDQQVRLLGLGHSGILVDRSAVDPVVTALFRPMTGASA